MDISHLSTIGRVGGRVRIARHGNPGTIDGRRQGGISSIQTHIRNKTKFKTLKPITIPRHSARLAELVGILMGDGHVGIGLHPTQKTKFRVFLRRREDIRRYFDVIGSSNEKHSEKVRRYFLTSKIKGGVA